MGALCSYSATCDTFVPSKNSRTFVMQVLTGDCKAECTVPYLRRWAGSGAAEGMHRLAHAMRTRTGQLAEAKAWSLLAGGLRGQLMVAAIHADEGALELAINETSALFQSDNIEGADRAAAFVAFALLKARLFV